MQRHHWPAVAGFIALSLIAACGATRPAAEPPTSETARAGDVPVFATPRPRPQATVVALVDGDTLILDVAGSEAPVRLIGIDAPEADLGQCFAAAASAFVAAVAPPGAALEVERDVSDRDAFGRLLRYVYLPDGSMLNERLVRGGFARVSSQPPDEKYVERLREAEAEARRDGVGIWSECATPTPAAIVAGPPAATATSTPVSAAVAASSPTPNPAPTPVPSTSTPAPTASPTSEPTPSPTATAAPTAEPTATAAPTPVPQPTATVDPRAGCDPSYPTVCIPPAPPDLDCGEISFRRFTVLQPDPHRFDGDKDGIGCES